MKFAISLVLAAAAAATAVPASAQFAKPEDAVKYRQSALFVMSQHFGRIGAMVNGRVPYDAAAACFVPSPAVSRVSAASGSRTRASRRSARSAAARARRPSAVSAGPPGRSQRSTSRPKRFSA